LRSACNLLFLEVFLQSIQDLGIEIIQTLSEADAEIARLGFRTSTQTSKKCYVVSNDTDFCIYDVNVVSLDSTLAKDVAEKDGKLYLACRQFDRTKFLKFFKIGPEKSGLLHLVSKMRLRFLFEKLQKDKILLQIDKMC
jgi:hypothetical protein